MGGGGGGEWLSPVDMSYLLWSGEFAVGKILFSTHNVIGHGSQGTTVFR